MAIDCDASRMRKVSERTRAIDDYKFFMIASSFVHVRQYLRHKSLPHTAGIGGRPPVEEQSEDGALKRSAHTHELTFMLAKGYGKGLGRVKG